MFVDELIDGKGERRPWAIGTKTAKGPGVIYELRSLAVKEFAESLGDVCLEAVGPYCQE